MRLAHLVTLDPLDKVDPLDKTDNPVALVVKETLVLQEQTDQK